MKISIRFAVALAAVALSAASSTPPYDYYVSLYQWPATTLSDGRKMEHVTVYLGNNAFDGAAPAGQPFNVWMKAINASGQEVCSATDVQLPPIPTGKSWGAYEFRVVYPKSTLVLGGKVRAPNVVKTTTYAISAMVSPEHPDGDRKTSNNYASQSFTFTAGGTASCETVPRPTFH